MARAKKKLNIHDALSKIQECISLLPGEDDKQRISKDIHDIITELNTLKNNIYLLPDESEKHQLSQAVHTLISFLDSLNDKPHLADTIFPKVKKAGKAKISTVNFDDLRKHLEELPTDQLMSELSKHKKNTLLELCSKLNITTSSRQTKDILIDKIFKLGFANRRGYDLLSNRQS
ncbi:glucosamine 6-phosphate synthetase [Candidatus Scalindua japonica]|uniref:Glucosamine 6-phosphate synthetase n=1 Tax=Candidatus Scalindua japonica TaxID=1284222 RepID=A0A286U074_9BACT|nr:hypothetical protein [Candidatus Scalindua japonica]GAX61549.1 glucosamine 6-phosphate synthetase [Candidatus Scalindua japonica]